MKVFEIWSEGFVCTGESGRAHCHGIINANTFKEACILFFSKPKNDKEKNFNEENMTFWGCRLFDNETDARQTYG